MFRRCVFYHDLHNQIFFPKKCIEGLLKEEPLGTSNQFCTYHCKNRNYDPIIQQMGKDTYEYITQVDGVLEIINSQFNTTQKVNQGNEPGALMIIYDGIPCHHRLVRYETILIREPFPCENTPSENAQTEIIIPTSWTNLLITS